jgi:hypothetical protein
MANWPALSPTEQQEKLTEITQEILPTLPHGWVRLVVRVKTIGTHSEADTGVKMPDGSVRGWSFTPEVWRKFQQLRKGMYAEGLGSWVEFEFILDPPGRYNIRYNRDNAPGFDPAPSPEDFATEQKWFPRADEQMPEWFRRGLAGANA